MNELITKLCKSSGISGFEMETSKLCKQLIEPYCDTTQIDKMGNVFGYKMSKNKDAKTVMLDAHIDQIGFIVSGITKDGFIKFTSIGGVDPRMLPATEVTIMSDEPIYGVISSVPPHLTSGGKQPQVDDLLIDVGFCEKQAREKIRVGTPVIFKRDVYNLSKDSITGKCLDDRAGIASIIYAFKELSEKELDVNIVACFSTKEEVSGVGSIVSTYKIKPDFAIAVDVTHGKTPDADSARTFELGKVWLGVGPNLNKKINEKLIKTAKAYDIPYGVEVMEGHTGTNAWYIQVSRVGVPVSLLSIPLKYMHTPIETVKISDVLHVSNLICRFLEDYRSDV